MIQIRPVSDLRNKFLEIEIKLDEADRASELSDIRYSHEEVFSRLRENDRNTKKKHG
jgi:hypothetical protein